MSRKSVPPSTTLSSLEYRRRYTQVKSGGKVTTYNTRNALPSHLVFVLAATNLVVRLYQRLSELHYLLIKKLSSGAINVGHQPYLNTRETSRMRPTSIHGKLSLLPYTRLKSQRTVARLTCTVRSPISACLAVVHDTFVSLPGAQN